MTASSILSARPSTSCVSTASDFAGRVRYGLSALYFSWLKDWRRLDRKPAEPWLLSILGRQAYDATWYPLLAVKFPQVHDRISAAWVWHRVHRVASCRKTLLHKEHLGFLQGGTQTLIDVIEERLRTAGVTLSTSDTSPADPDRRWARGRSRDRRWRAAPF